MALVGAGIITAFWLPRFLSGREPAASALLLLFGIAIHWILPGVSQALDPREAPLFWELTSELAVIVALFGTGIRIDNVSDHQRWRPTIRLLAIAMPITIAAVAVMGLAFAGMTLAGAILLGAVLAPTDPVLAGEVQVGPPTEGGEHPVRFALTTEAGLNDGLAFPFVYLGLLAGTTGFSAAMLGEWLLLDVFYRIIVGCLSGAAVGWALARALFVIPRGNVLADTASGVLAIAGVLLCYGVTELAEGYGFIACFVAGVVLRRVEARHAFHGKLHGFNEAIELALTALLLILIGATFPRLYGELDWAHAWIVLGLLLVVRPVAGWVSMWRTGLPPADRLVIAFYGVRGIGSIYYLGYAASHLELVNEGQLWATITLAILLSTVIHGFTAGPVVDHIVRRR
jgi:sodium/hydrogen antiporter